MYLFPVLLADGYGISFADISKVQIDDENIGFEIPDNRRRGQLTIIVGDDGSLFPAIKIGDEVTICLAFTCYLEDGGWKDVDMSCITSLNTSDIRPNKPLALKLSNSKWDMTGYGQPVPMEKFLSEQIGGKQ